MDRNEAQSNALVRTHFHSVLPETAPEKPSAFIVATSSPEHHPAPVRAVYRTRYSAPMTAAKSPTARAGAKRSASKSGPLRPSQAKNTHALAGIPVSVYAPLELAHRLELFGNEFKVHISTHFTFNPDTISRAVMDVSLDASMRRWAPAAHQLLRKVAYVAAGKHQPSETTKRLIVRHLEPVVPSDEVRRALDGHDDPVQPRSDWDTFLKGLEGGQDEVLKDLCRCLAACDAHALHIRALARAGAPEAAQAHVAALFNADISAWVDLNPSLQPLLYVLIEVALKALAWVECRLEKLPDGAPTQASCLDGLLAPGRRPLGNWLGEVCAASGCRNLGQLADRLQWRSQYHERPISHDLLRKWSSSRKLLMPAAAMPATLAAVGPRNWAETLPGRFYAARLLTFLCALLRAGTNGPTPSWEEVQDQLRSRYAHAYRLQCQQPPAAGVTRA